MPRRKDYKVAAAPVTLRGKDLPVIREIVKLGEVETSVEIPELAEPELRHIVALLAALDRFEGAAQLAPALLLELVAGLYIKHGDTPETWRAYTASLRVPRSKTRQPDSMFQPFLRWANGGKPDTTGRLAKLAAPLEEWVELGDNRPSPITSIPGTSEFARWYSRNNGYTNVAERRRGWCDEIYSKSESANVVPFDDTTGSPRGEASARTSDGEKFQERALELETTKHAISYSESNSDDEVAWVTPPEFLAELNEEFNFTSGFDPCPYPRPEGFDGLKVPWPESTYCNPPFRKQNGIGIAAFARKAIEENQLGNTVVLVLPTFGTINYLLEAGAELRSARRINWIDPKTGQPATTSPSSNMLAILRGKTHALPRSGKTPPSAEAKENEIDQLKVQIAALETANAMLKARIEELTSPPGKAIDTSKPLIKRKVLEKLLG
jgi:hypothetical protein